MFCYLNSGSQQECREILILNFSVFRGVPELLFIVIRPVHPNDKIWKLKQEIFNLNRKTYFFQTWNDLDTDTDALLDSILTGNDVINDRFVSNGSDCIIDDDGLSARYALVLLRINTLSITRCWSSWSTNSAMLT